MGKKPRKFDAPGHRVPTQLCPKCGWLLDAASCLDDANAKPQPGDYTVCIGCAAMLVFTDELRINLATLENIAALRETDPEYLAEIQRVRFTVLLLPKDKKTQGPRN